jgi:uncharacterized protein with GYD domain
MPYSTIMGKWTEQGLKSVKQSPQRVAIAKEIIEKRGGRWRGIYYTFGDYDFVAFVEQGKASDGDVMGSLLGIAGAGAVRTKTLKAFSLPEFRKVLGKVPKPRP